jgi:hypothetical protein
MGLKSNAKGKVEQDDGSEQWIPAKWKGMSVSKRYEVSSMGRIRSLTQRPVELRAAVGTNGYMQVCLTDEDGFRATVKVHRAVAEAFIGELPVGMTVNHIDGNKKNNVLANLEVVTNLENVRHASRTIEARTSVLVHGKRMALSEALESYGNPAVNYKRAYARINRMGWDVVKAISTPRMKAGRPYGIKE